MRVLLLGGTGAMGAHLCNILAGACEVYVTTRKERKCSEGITYIKGDAHDILFLQSLLIGERWDSIVDFMVYNTDEFRKRINLFLTATNQYVFLSSSRVYAKSDEPITENSPRLLDVCKDKDYLATDEYALTKARQEDILINSGMSNWTIVRPYITFSEIRLQLSPAEKEYWLFGALQGKSILFSRDLADKYTTLTYGYDVARGIAALIGEKGAFGEAFHITVNESYKWSDILDVYLNVIENKMGFRPKVNMLEKWNPNIGGKPCQVKWDRLYNRRFDNSKINNFINTTTFKHTLPALQDCLTAFIDNPHFSDINWLVEARKDRINGEWMNIFNITSTKQKIKYLLVRTNLYPIR